MTNLFGHKNAHLAALLFGGWRYWKQEKNRWLALLVLLVLIVLLFCYYFRLIVLGCDDTK